MVLKKYQVPGTVPSGKPPKSEPYRTVPCRTMQWKSAICSFVSTYIASTGPTRISLGNSVILAGGFENSQEVKRVSKSGIDCLEDLYSDQKEADTRLVLHAIHLAQSHSRHILVTDDNVDE